MGVYDAFAKGSLTLSSQRQIKCSLEDIMLLTLPFPNIDPEIFSIELFGLNFALRWYALAYIAGIVIGWRILVRMMRREDIWGGTAPMTPAKAEDILTWQIVGVVLGGRLGYVFFYNLEYFLAHPNEILRVWEGGMAFHGGLLGVVVATFLFSRIYKVPFWSLGDAIAVVAPIGLFLGRIANFIRPELWGKPTTVPWAVYFPDPAAQTCPDDWLLLCTRHPSQLYEAGLEGLLLGAILMVLAFRGGILKYPGRAMGLFIAFYGAARFFVEFFREADAQFITPDNPLGHVFTMGGFGISQGQLLSIPMIAFGIALMLMAKKRV